MKTLYKPFFNAAGTKRIIRVTISGDTQVISWADQTTAPTLSQVFSNPDAAAECVEKMVAAWIEQTDAKPKKEEQAIAVFSALGFK